MASEGFSFSLHSSGAVAPPPALAETIEVGMAGTSDAAVERRAWTRELSAAEVSSADFGAQLRLFLKEQARRGCAACPPRLSALAL